MSTTKRPEDVQDHLAQLAISGSTPAGQLMFDPSTGELLVQSRGEAKSSPDVVVADVTATTGYFI
jgi:hypothetical protein